MMTFPDEDDTHVVIPLVTVQVQVPEESPVIVVLVPVPVVVFAPGVLVNVHVPVAGKPLKTTLPVAVPHVGCTIVPTIGAVGLAGSVKLAFTPVAEVHVLAVICKLLYVPAGAEMVAVPPVTVTPAKLPEV